MKYLFITSLMTLLFFSQNFSFAFAQQAPNNPQDNPTKPTINIIGDSLIEGAAPQLKSAFPNSTLDAAVSRQWNQGISILQNLITDGKLAPIVIFALGTNSATDDAGVDRVMELTGNSKVLFTTVYGSTTATQHNNVLKSAISRYPGRIIIADWYSIASANPNLLREDGIHPNTEGQQAFAKTIIDAANGTSSLPISTSSRAGTATSNMLCVKVGEPTTDKPAICSQPATNSQSGTGSTDFGPPIAGAEPTLEPCGKNASGQDIMCYKPAYVFYCQGDPRWANVPDPGDTKGCFMSGAGCGPTTMAMIFSAYGDTITPLDMDQKIFRGSYRACGNTGSAMQTAVQNLLPARGYEYEPLSAPLNLSQAQEYLNAGYLIIGSTTNHIFAIDGVNVGDKTLRLRDPARCENKDGVIRPASAPWNGEALYYAYAVRKKPVVK